MSLCGLLAFSTAGGLAAALADLAVHVSVVLNRRGQITFKGWTLLTSRLHVHETAIL